MVEEAISLVQALLYTNPQFSSGYNYYCQQMRHGINQTHWYRRQDVIMQEFVIMVGFFAISQSMPMITWERG